MRISLLGGLWTNITDFITGIFALIPQFIYFFYTCIASLLDLCQFVVRKFAGLDVYYVGESATAVEGDLISNFINGILGINGEYSTLSTVFWALIIFGVIIMILSLILSIIKSHYNYDEKKSSLKFIFKQLFKGLANFAIVPLCVVFGVLLSNYLLQALDSITGSKSNNKMEQVFASSNGNYTDVFKSADDEWGNKTYYSYDFFGSYSPTAHQTFSGLIFQAAAYECNRVRYGGFTASTAGETWSDIGVFNSNLDSPEDQKEAVATMIDFAFANNLTTKSPQTASVLKDESAVLISSYRYLQSAVWYAGTWNFNNFSKYNVGLVWYYYNLWSFNYIIGFVGVIIGLSILGSIVLGMAARLLECVALFLVYGPVVGITPLDNGEAVKSWRKLFVGDVLMAYSAVLGFNFLFLIMPYLQMITFFTKPILNYIMNMIITVVLLLALKDLVSMFSSFIGAEDPVKRGSDIKNDLTKPLKQAVAKAATLAMLGAKVLKFVPGVGAAAKGVEKVATKIHQINARKAANKAAKKGQTKVMKSTYNQLKKENEEEAKVFDDQAASLNAQADEEDKKLDEALLNEDNEKAAGENEENARVQAQTQANKEKSRASLAETEANKLDKDAKDERDLEAAERATLKTSLEASYGVGDPRVAAELANFDATNAHGQAAARLEEEANKKRQEAIEANTNAEKFQNEADQHEAKRDEHLANLENFSKEVKEAHDNATRLREQADQESAKAAEVRSKMNQYQVRDFSGAKKAVNLTGQTFKVAGSVLGFDSFIEALKNETVAVDNGKLAIREFAQAVTGKDLSDKSFLQTAKESEASGKEKLRKETSFSLRESNSQMLNEVNALGRAFRASKKK